MATAYDALVMKAREIVNRGCGCDHSCCDEIDKCGCYDDAKKIIDLTLDTISRQGSAALDQSKGGAIEDTPRQPSRE